MHTLIYIDVCLNLDLFIGIDSGETSGTLDFGARAMKVSASKDYIYIYIYICAHAHTHTGLTRYIYMYIYIYIYI